MIAAIGVFLLLAGVSAFLIGLIRVVFPSSERFIPEDLKRVMSLRYGVYTFLAGMLLVKFF